VRTKGDHRQYHHPRKEGTVTVAGKLSDEVPPGTLQYSSAGRPETRIEMKYLVVIEKGPKSFGAYVPDLPGCVAVAKTRRRVKRLIQEALQLHVDDMREGGYPIPKPTAASEFVELQFA
jgi:predicted RNase H-like HicB family nuclease